MTDESAPQSRGQTPANQTPDNSRPATAMDDELGSKPGSRLEVRASRRKKRDDSEEAGKGGAYRVTFTVTIAQAVPTVKTEVDLSSPIAPSRLSRGTTATGTGEDEDGRASRRKRVMEAPRAQHLYHLEYTLVPDQPDQAVRTDLVSFGVAAKIYTEKQEAKVIKTWVENDITWVAWTHCHTVTMTDELLLKLFTHSLELRIWDTRDKISPRAKTDRPRTFKFPPVKAGEEHTCGVKTLVLKQSRSFEKMQPKRAYIDRPLPSQPRPTTVPDDPALELEREVRASRRKSRGGAQPPVGGEQVPDKLADYLDKAGHHVTDSGGRAAGQPGAPERTYSHVQELAGPSDSRLSKPSSRLSAVGKPRSASPGRALAEKPDKPSTADSNKRSKAAAGRPSLSQNQGSSASQQDPAGPGSQTPAHAGPQDPQDPGAPPGTMRSSQSAGGGEGGARRGRDKKKEREAAAHAEHVKKHGKCVVAVRMTHFFAGAQTVTERLPSPVDSVPDLFLTVSVNKPLMSEEQRQRLNPLTLRVTGATNMPNSPLSYDVLRMRCLPAYVKYNWFGRGEHRSVGRAQDSAIYWDDVNVVLAGTLDPAEVREYLCGPPLEIAVHDRDRVPDKQKLAPTLFGDDLEDEKINNVGTVASRRTLHNAFATRERPWDPHGVARFDLSDLLLGQRVLHLQAPIHACAPPDVLGHVAPREAGGKLVGVAGAVDGPVGTPLPVGKYLDSSAALKIKVEVAHPLVTPNQLAAKIDIPGTDQCPFSRILFKFAYKNVTFLTKVQSLLTEINAQALGLKDMPPHVIEAALSTYKLSVEQQRSRELDIVTGFHVLDGEMHLFVLEGLREGALRYILVSLPKPSNSDVVLLYNSDLALAERAYGPLDVDVCRIKLHEPLATIVKQPLLYVRDMVPAPCFSALVKLHQLWQCSKLRDAWRSDLFPTADQVVSMSREFGVPITAEDFEELSPQLPQIAETSVRHYAGPATSRVWTPIDNSNDPWLTRLAHREREGQREDFGRINKSLVRERSNLNKLSRSKTTLRPSLTVAHNYSTQTLNSTEQARKQLRELLAQDPERRYTYCQDYAHSMTFVPADVTAEAAAEQQASRDQWRTPAGWTYPGRRTFQESNAHAYKPGPARIDELKQPWEENWLHAKLRPVLERDRLPWPERKQDLDIWTKPPQTFGQEPATIHLAGELQRQERQAAVKAEAEAWRSRVVVDELRAQCHRKLPTTELTAAGPKSSNQLDLLTGLLKDPAKKLSLKRPGLAIADIPPLSVVLHPSVDTAARLAGKPTPPALPSEFNQKVRGLRPGENEDRGWHMIDNVVPCYDYEHARYAQERGADFNAHFKPRWFVHKRGATTLTDGEYKTHLFRLPPELSHFRDASYQLPDPASFQSVAEAEGALSEGLATTIRAPAAASMQKA